MTHISHIVIQRVRTIHAIRPLLGRGALALVIFVAALYGIGQEVFVAKVIENMPSVSDMGALARFVTAAFLNTAFLVQALVIASLLSVGLLIRDSIRFVAAMPVRASL